MLQVQHLNRSFGDTNVLNDVSLTVNEGEILCLLGRSGSGKTTLLRIIAGLESAESGSLRQFDQDITATPVHKRDFGLMFQDFALFPHMTVAENVTFGLKMKRFSPSEKTQRVAEVLELVGLAGYDQRDVSSLSGGERQRVALARSLAPRPRLLMLDEPLGSLDAALRGRLGEDLRRIIKAVGLTAIYVTHDQQEAFTIADRIAVMHNGRMIQIDTPHALYQHPKTRYVAQFLGLNNLFPIEGFDGKRATTQIGTFSMANTSVKHLLLHPDGLSLSATNGIPAEVISQTFQGSTYRLVVRHHSGQTLSFDVAALPNRPPNVGTTVRINVEDWAVLGVDA
jgi:ABC-type Fe3+/spermidine/putrescine transport system ATPase subunit